MKISTKKLRKLIQETLDERSTTHRRATMIHEIRDMGDDLMSELWGKKKPAAKPVGPDKFSQPLEAADIAMSEVVSSLWGPWDTPPRSDLLKKAQALHKEIKAAAEDLKK